jgi:hypothetical protein
MRKFQRPSNVEIALAISCVAEDTGVEPVRDCSHEFSRLAHYRPAHPPTIYIFLFYHPLLKIRIEIIFYYINSGGGEIRTRASLTTQRFSEPSQWTNYATPPGLCIISRS